MAEPRPKTLHYRFVEGLNDGRTLQGVLEPILYDTHLLVKDRAEAVSHDDPKETVRRCITERRSYGNMLFGMLIEYVAGTDKQAVTIDETREDLPLEQVNLPKAEGKPREFVDGAVYFGIWGNHLAVMQSQTLQDRHLESHLGWLIISQADALESTERLGLRRELTLTQEEIDRVTGVSIGSGLIKQEEELPKKGSAAKEAHEGSVPTKSIQLTDISQGILQQLLGTDWQERLKTEEYDELDSLEVTINVRKKGGPRKPGNDAERLMGALTTQLRHTYSEDVTIHTKQGTISGDTIFLRESTSIECHHGVPLVDNVYLAMRDWIQRKYEEGVINPE